MLPLRTNTSLDEAKFELKRDSDNYKSVASVLAGNYIVWKGDKSFDVMQRQDDGVHVCIGRYWIEMRWSFL